MGIFKFRNIKTGQATPIPPGDFTIGRADDAYIHLDDGSVSRHHAKIYNDDDGFYVEDLGSANGTAAHGKFITGRQKVELGDVIHVGSVAFRIDPEVAGEAATAPSAGLRAVERSYISRDTEKLGSARIVEKFSSEHLAAPKINPTADADAEELNAITIREPAAPAPAKLPVVRSGGTPLPASSPEPAAAPKAPTQIPGQFVPPRTAAQTELARQLQPVTPATAPTPGPEKFLETPFPAPVVTAPETETAQPGAFTAGVHFGWLVIIFLAGLGVGLLLGLYFAGMYLDLGKAAGVK